MGIYNQFSLLPYIPSKNKFQLQNNRTEIFTEKDSTQVIIALKNNAKNFIYKEKAAIIQNALNRAIAEQKENYEKMIDKIAHELNNTSYEKLLSLGVIKRREGTIQLDSQKAQLYNKEIREIASQLSGYQKEDDIVKVIQRLSGSLNKMRGDIFENFLAVSLENIGILLNTASENVEDMVVEEVSNVLKKYGGKKNTVIIKNNKNSYSSKNSKVMGDILKENLTFYLDENKITIKGSQGKTDVAIKNLDGNFLGISAKNYQSGSRQISLLTNANISGLVSDWPGITLEQKNLALNGLSAMSINEQQFNIMKKIFLIQGLMGLSSEDIKSQLFIINRNTIKNPILVFSVYDLLFNQNIKGDFQKEIYSIGIPRNNNDFLKFIQNSRLSIHTQLKLSQLAKL